MSLKVINSGLVTNILIKTRRIIWRGNPIGDGTCLENS
jgi:hypothetical protein